MQVEINSVMYVSILGDIPELENIFKTNGFKYKTNILKNSRTTLMDEITVAITKIGFVGQKYIFIYKTDSNDSCVIIEPELIRSYVVVSDVVW